MPRDTRELTQEEECINKIMALVFEQPESDHCTILSFCVAMWLMSYTGDGDEIAYFRERKLEILCELAQKIVSGGLR